MQAPRFILLGAEVLRSVLDGREEDSAAREDVDAEFLRRLRMNQFTDQDHAQLQRIHHRLLGGAEGEPPSSSSSSSSSSRNASTSSTIESLRTILIAQARWTSFCAQQAYHDILASCPHLLGPVLGDETKRTAPDAGGTLFLDQLDLAQLADVLELQYGRISAKLKQLRALEEERIAHAHQLQLLLKELGSDLSPTLLANLHDGACLINDMHPRYKGATGEEVLLRELHTFQEILSGLETDLKSEDVFWKWLLPATDDRSMDNTDPSTARNQAMANSYLSHLRAVEAILLPAVLQGRLPPETIAEVVCDGDRALRGLVASLAGRVDEARKAPSRSSAEEAEGPCFASDLLQYCGQSAPSPASEALQNLRQAHSAAIADLLTELQPSCPYTFLSARPAPNTS